MSLLNVSTSTCTFVLSGEVFLVRIPRRFSLSMKTHRSAISVRIKERIRTSDPPWHLATLANYWITEGQSPHLRWRIFSGRIYTEPLVERGNHNAPNRVLWVVPHDVLWVFHWSLWECLLREMFATSFRLSKCIFEFFIILLRCSFSILLAHMRANRPSFSIRLYFWCCFLE